MSESKPRQKTIYEVIENDDANSETALMQDVIINS